jgi:sugar (pentulose or hexulose) kinase
VRLRSQLWGIPVWSIGKQDATTVGAAMLAGIAAGIFSGAQDAADALVRPAVLVGHDGADRAAIARARRRWQAAARFAGGAGGW